MQVMMIFTRGCSMGKIHAGRPVNEISYVLSMHNVHYAYLLHITNNELNYYFNNFILLNFVVLKCD